MAELVDEEHPISIPVERQPHVGLRGEDPSAQIGEILLLDRIRGVVRKGTVELAVEHLKMERQTEEDPRRDETTHAVCRVRDDPQRLERSEVDEASDVVREFVQE